MKVSSTPIRNLKRKLKSDLSDLPLFGNNVVLTLNRMSRSFWSTKEYAKRQYRIARTPTISRRQFLREIKAAVEEGRGYAAGKIGADEQTLMYYEIFLQMAKDPEKINQYNDRLIYAGLKQRGIFPTDPEFYLRFNQFYVDHLRNLDFLGIFYYPRELQILNHFNLANKLLCIPHQ